MALAVVHDDGLGVEPALAAGVVAWGVVGEVGWAEGDGGRGRGRERGEMMRGEVELDRSGGRGGGGADACGAGGGRCLCGGGGGGGRSGEEGCGVHVEPKEVEESDQ